MHGRRFCLLWVLVTLLAIVSMDRGRAAGAARPQPQSEVRALLQEGLQAYQGGRLEDSLRLFTEALTRARALSDKAGEATTLANSGALHREMGQPQKALEFYDQALPLHRAAGDKAGEALTLHTMGSVYLRIGQPQRAMEYFLLGLPLVKAAGDKAGEATTLYNIGALYEKIGQPRKGLEYLTQALALHRGSGNKRDEAETLEKIGEAYGATGQPHKALELYNQALPLLRAVGDQAWEAATLANIGEAYREIRQPQKALEYLHQALPLARGLGDRAAEAATLNNLGAVYRGLGQPRQALECLNQALPLARAVSDKAREATALNNFGAVHREIGQPQRALEYFTQALPLVRTLGDRAGEATALNNIGSVYTEIGQPQKALEYLNQALPLARAVEDEAGEARTLNNIGAVYQDIRQPQKALEFYNQALPLARAAGNKTGEAGIMTNIAALEASLGRFASARDHLRDALTLLEQTRGELGGLSQAKISFLGSNLAYYHAYIHLLLKLNDRGAAFAWAQKTKARALLDLLHDGKVAITQGATPEEQQRERDLKQQAGALNRRWVAEALKPDADKTRLAELKQELARAENELQTFTDSLYARHPALARKRAGSTARLADVAAFLPPDTALLEYVVLRAARGPNETVLFCVTVEQDKALLAVFRITVPREELAEKVDDFRAACADPTRRYEAKAREIYDLLVAPAARQIAGKKRLIVCPDGPLWGLPFQALLVEGQPGGGDPFLLARYEIAYAASATAAQAALLGKQEEKRARPDRTLLVFANPAFGELGTEAAPAAGINRPLELGGRDLFLGERGKISPLPGTQTEAEALKADFPDAHLYTGEQAQERTAKQESGQGRYLHFATHGLLNDHAPLMSSVVLAAPPAGSAEDGFLTAREIFDLNLAAELVVLSACDTARGEQRAGEGVVGLTWALFVAGAPSQVLSQWKVSDASTAELMKGFYGKLKAGAGKGAALRGAALALRGDGKHEHPYYWAPFILVGDWR